MDEQSKYNLRGVSAKKEEVHQAIKHLDKGLFPNAFCKVLPDIAAGDADFCNLMHADTAGTKTSLAYLYWKETKDSEVWKGIAQDAIVMNLDDMACCGCVDNIILSSTIGRNKHLIPGEVISAIINGTASFLEGLDDHGIRILLAGGETADVGDIVRTVDVGITAFARMKKAEVIENKIQAGDCIVGLASYGQASYEYNYNSGIGSNGLTSARHDVLSSYYREQYPESFDPNTPDAVTYIGSKRLQDVITMDGVSYPVGKLLLSPTRTYLPVVKALLANIDRKAIHGIIHCTGGAQTKVLKFIERKKVIKNNLFDLPPVFQMIQEETGTDWREMYEVFNMGHRLELYLPEEYAQRVIDITSHFNIAAQIIGHVEESKSNRVVVESQYGHFEYQ